MSNALKLIFNLFKLRIGVVIALTAVAGYAVQPGAGPEAWRLAVLAGAAAISPEAALAPLPLAFAWILFLWTPPHFWSLAIAFQDDYREAGVPMLPVVKGDAYAARAILAHAVVLVALSWGLAAFRPGWIYLAFAVVGGTLFVREALRLVAAPSRQTAMRCFHASLAQLSLLLVGAMVDAAVL